jgi:hypothetical protein
MKTEQTKTETHSEQQARFQCESILEIVRALDKRSAAEDWAKDQTDGELARLLKDAEIERNSEDLRGQIVDCIEDDSIEPEDFKFDEDAARETIINDPLSVEVRSDWTSPGHEMAPAEFCILLCTGGPAVRIVGDLNRGEPSNPRVEHQDWGTPWTEFFPTNDQREALQVYVSLFYYGA